MNVSSRLRRLELSLPESCDCHRHAAGRRLFVVTDERDAEELARGRAIEARWAACPARHADDDPGLLVVIRRYSAMREFQ
jgi:hypothetical protein